MAENASKTLVINIEGNKKGLDKTLAESAKNIEKFKRTLETMTDSERDSLASVSAKKYAQFQKWASSGKTAETRAKYTQKIEEVKAARYYAKVAEINGSYPGMEVDARGNAPARYPIDTRSLDLANKIGDSIGKAFGYEKETPAPKVNKLSPEALKESISKLVGNVKPFIAAIEKAAKAVGKFVSKIAKGIKSVASFGAAIIKNRLNIAEFAKRIKNLEKAFIRVVTYKAIRTFLSILNSGLKTGINNLYKFSSLLEGKFKTSMDNFATSWLYVQNAVGAFTGTIINMVMPVVTALLDKLAEMANALAKFSASVLGSGYYQATKQVQKYSDMVGEAAANQNQLLGFDELNVLSSSGASASGMFGDYSEFSDGLSDIDSVLDKIIDKINTLVSGFDIDGFATKIGNKINKIIGYFNKLMDGVDFVAIGRKLSQGINTLLEVVNPQELGKALSQKINMIADFVKGFVEDFEWGAAGTWLANVLTSWIESIKWDSVIKAVTGIINGVFTFAKSFIENVPWVEKAEHLAGLVNDMIEDIDTVKIGNVLSEVITTIFDAAAAFLNKLDWEAIGTKVGELINAIDWASVFRSCLNFIWGVFKGVLSAFGSTITYTPNSSKIDEEWDKYQNQWNTTYGNLSKKTVFKDAQVKASGGSVNTGSLFWAGEAGPELVTSVGGRSTVYNEQQLGASIALGNENVVAAINTLIGVVRSKNNNVTISASDIRKAVNSSSMRLGV